MVYSYCMGRWMFDDNWLSVSQWWRAMMNGCCLPITRKFLLRSQVQGNTNLTEEGKDTWNSSGFRLMCTDPGAVFREVSKSPVPLSPTSRHLSDLWFHSVPPLSVKQPDLLGFVVGLVFIVVVIVVVLPLTILFSKLLLLSHSENWSQSVRLSPVSSYY